MRIRGWMPGKCSSSRIKSRLKPMARSALLLCSIPWWKSTIKSAATLLFISKTQAVIQLIIMRRGSMEMMIDTTTPTFSRVLVSLTSIRILKQDKNKNFRNLTQETLLWYVDHQNLAIWEIFLRTTKTKIILFIHLPKIQGLKVYSRHREVQISTILIPKQVVNQAFSRRRRHSNLISKLIRQTRVYLILL